MIKFTLLGALLLAQLILATIMWHDAQVATKIASSTITSISASLEAAGDYNHDSN